MNLKSKKIGLAICGSFCNHHLVYEVIDDLKKENADVIPIISNNVKDISTRFGDSDKFYKRLEELTGNKVIDSIVKSEPIGPKNLVDIIAIIPCTGNTLAKLNYGIIDTPVLMAAKSHLRNNKPVVIGISTNDALGVNAKNIGELLNTKNIFFVPFRQDDFEKKPKSLVFDSKLVVQTIEKALDEIQVQPLLV